MLPGQASHRRGLADTESASPPRARMDRALEVVRVRRAYRLRRRRGTRGGAGAPRSRSEGFMRAGLVLAQDHCDSPPLSPHREGAGEWVTPSPELTRTQARGQAVGVHAHPHGFFGSTPAVLHSLASAEVGVAGAAPAHARTHARTHRMSAPPQGASPKSESRARAPVPGGRPPPPQTRSRVEPQDGSLSISVRLVCPHALASRGLVGSAAQGRAVWAFPK